MPTKISFRLVPRRALDRQTAWACFFSNLFVPGSGTLLAGRAIGYAQLAVMLLSLLLTTVFGVHFIIWSFENWQKLQAQFDPVQYLTDVWLAVRWALAGIGLFGLGWLWGLGSSVVILCQARQPPSIPPRPAPESQVIR
jgi:hypothetical protein